MTTTRARRGLDLSSADAGFAERFWSKVTKSADCWTWSAYRKPNGYGQFTVRKGVFFGAHNVSFALTSGPIPAGQIICHRCDNPPCVRPDHLFMGTQVDNALDMVAKGRANTVRGVDHRDARLTEDDVRYIRSVDKYRGVTLDLAAEYGISVHAVSMVRLRRTWRHVS